MKLATSPNAHLTPDEVKDLIGGLSYKPGHSFRCWFDDSGVVFIGLTALFPTSNSLEGPVQVEQVRSVPITGLTRRTLIDQVTRLVSKFESHESAEWLRVGNVRLFHPHDEVVTWSRFGDPLEELLHDGSAAPLPALPRS